MDLRKRWMDSATSQRCGNQEMFTRNTLDIQCGRVPDTEQNLANLTFLSADPHTCLKKL